MYYLDIGPELRNKVKAFAALKGKTMRDWLTETIIAKLEDEIMPPRDWHPWHMLKVQCLLRILLVRTNASKKAE